MEYFDFSEDALADRLSARLRSLRTDQGWSLDDLAAKTGISRATISRLENGAVSPTASVLGKICAAYGLSMSRLMYLVEEDFQPLVKRTDQSEWIDASSGFVRRSISPPAETLTGEVLECRIGAGQHIAYDTPPRHDLEHHLVLIEGSLTVTVEGRDHRLKPGDCLRYRLNGQSAFRTRKETGARYMLFIV